MSFYDDTDKIAGGENFRYKKPNEKNGAVIQFYQVATIKKSLEAGSFSSQATFKAFLTDFKDNYKVNWNGKETFGRMDAIQTYKNTQRQINIQFEVPSVSVEEAELNFLNLQSLIQMQYPVYEVVETTKIVTPATPATEAATTTSNTRTDRDLGAAVVKASEQPPTAPVSNNGISRFISSPPLIYVKFMNWISGDLNSPSLASSDMQNALVVVLNEVSFNPDLEQGYHFSEDRGGLLIPKLFTVNLNLTVIHTQELGWVNKVEGSVEQLDNHQFGQPRAVQGKPGFVTYPTYPYQTGDFYYNKNTTVRDDKTSNTRPAGNAVNTTTQRNADSGIAIEDFFE